MTILQSVLTVLVSLLGSGVVSAYVTHKLASSEKRRELMRQKLEQLYLCGVDYQNMLFLTATMSAAYHGGKVDKEAVTTLFNKDAEKNKETNNNLNMLCHIYFPHLVPFLDSIRKHQDNMGNAGLKAAVFGESPDKQKGSQILIELRSQKKIFDDFNQEVFKTGLEINAR